MARTIGLVEWVAGGDVTRQPLAWRRFYDRPLVEWIARRLTDAERLEAVFVSVPDAAAHLTDTSAIPPDVTLLPWDQPSRIERLLQLAAQTDCDGIVGVRIDSPLVDPGLIDRLIQTAMEGSWDYVTYICRDGRPVLNSEIGLGAEWISAESLRRLAQVVETPADGSQNYPASQNCQDIAGLMLQHGSAFASRFLPLPEGLDRPELRLTLADDEDWDTAEDIVETLGCESLDWPNIANWLDSHPHLLQQMDAHSRHCRSSNPSQAAKLNSR